MTLPLSDAKARLSDVVRTVRRTREGVVITVDGVPAVRIEAVDEPPRLRLTDDELRVARALRAAARAIPWGDDSFDAVELVGQGRR